MKKQKKHKVKIKELKTESVLERFSTYQIEDNYAPYKVIQNFWKKYNLFESQEPKYWLRDLPRMTRPERDAISLDDELFTSFNRDVTELLKAIYFQSKYGTDNWKTVFLK